MPSEALAANSSTPPGWFTNAINTPYTVKTVVVDGCDIEYYQWNKADKPLLLFVHGNGGHANWWDFIAPSFIEQFCVCALHLAGMGNSGSRAEYSLDSFAKDLIAVAEDAGYRKNITIVGHSMGGMITLRAAENYPEQVKAIVIIDSPMIFRFSNDPAEANKAPVPAHHDFKGKKYYPDRDTAFQHFRLIPAQECKNRFLVDHVGHHSIKQFPEGWSWKFDNGIYFNLKHTGKRPPFDLEKIHCKFAYIYGDKSALVPQHVIPELKELLKNKGPVFGIKDAHHHIMLDEPLALIQCLKEILQAMNMASP